MLEFLTQPLPIEFGLLTIGIAGLLVTFITLKFNK